MALQVESADSPSRMHRHQLCRAAGKSERMDMCFMDESQGPAAHFTPFYSILHAGFIMIILAPAVTNQLASFWKLITH